MSKPDGGEHADTAAVAVNGFLAPCCELRLVEPEQQQPPAHAALALGHERVAPDEPTSLVPGDRERHAGLERRVLRRQLVAPRPIALLQPHPPPPAPTPPAPPPPPHPPPPD